MLGQEELLEHEPDPGRPQRRRAARSGRAGTSKPATRTVPVVGRSRVPMMWSREVLPDPDGPTTATSSPAATVTDTALSASTGGWPG